MDLGKGSIQVFEEANVRVATRATLALLTTALALFSCVKDYPDSPFLAFTTPPVRYSITVQVSGASGSFSIANGSDTFTISGNGAHELSKTYPSGSVFNITIATHPAGQNCTVGGGSNTLTANVSNITITCTNTSIYNVTQNRSYISANPGAFNAVQISFQSAYNGTYAIKSGPDCTSGTTYPDAAATGALTSGGTVNVTLNATTGGTPLAAGPNTVLICGTDTAPALVDTIPVTVTVDNTPPVVSASPGAGSYIAAQSVTIGCSDPGSGCVGTAYSSANAVMPAAAPNPADPTINTDGTGATPFAYSAPLPAGDGDITTIEAIAVDGAGNRSAVQVYNFTVDSNYSNISITGATNLYISSATAKNSTAITWTSDRSNRPYIVMIGGTNCGDGTPIDTGTTGAGGHTTPAIPVASFGPSTDQAYTVRVCEANYAGSYDLGQTIVITRDETAPSLTAETGNNSYVAHNNYVFFRFNESLDTGATVIAGGDLENEDNGGLYATNSFTDDELRVGPQIGAHAAGMAIWAPGLSRALDVTVADLAGNTATFNRSYLMRDGTVEPHYSNAANWNFYVKNDGSNVMDATNTACAGTESNFYYSCLHGGEFRKVKVLDKIDDCTGLTAADSQSFFNWTCYDPPGAGPVEMVSTSMKPGVSLTKIIDFGGSAFLSNQVTVTGSSVPAAPASTAWWNNTIQTLPAAGGSALTAGVIYIAPANVSLAATFSVQAENVAVVTAPTATVRSAGADPMIENTGKLFSWIEGNFDGNVTANAGISLNGSSGFHRLEKVRVWNVVGNAASGGIELKNVTDSLLFDVRVANVTNGNGILISDSTGQTSRNIIRRVSLYNNGGSGLSLQASAAISDLIVFDFYSSSNGGAGIDFQGTGSFRNSIIMNSTLVHNVGYGINLGNTGNTDSISLINLAVVNSGQNGLYMTPGSVNHQIIDGAYVLNGVAEINMNGSASAYVSGLFVVGIIPAPCLNFNADFSDPACNAPEVTLDTSIFNGSTAATGFINHRGSADPANASAPSAAYGPAMDWVNFNFPWRMWGKTGINFNSYGGICNVGTCRQLDYALFSGAHQMHNRHGCPAAAVSQDVVNHNWATATSGSVTFLRHAYETDTDNVWDLPFCLGNETCFINPNLGAYQGHGTPGPAGCPAIGTGGLIENVNFQTFANNGFVSP
ncbi:MAG: hypothetical protein CMN76_17805 [Spirochaetaceae bacterium]|nr:hypothetical protein [Spirochaetaceae bacterium]|tara:strand:- start:114528 stop:118049 length:3522 start_codon:yes stop_codon:yes gene_type:complete